jgi:hypothetical protein
MEYKSSCFFAPNNADAFVATLQSCCFLAVVSEIYTSPLSSSLHSRDAWYPVEVH